MSENENKNLIFRIVTIEKGTYRTVSSCFFTEIENLLEKIDIENRKFGWLYKEDLTSIEHKNETKIDIENEQKFCWITLKVGSPCGIEPQSLIMRVLPLDYKDLTN